MKKRNFTALEPNLVFMKTHLKNPADFSALVETGVFILTQFSYHPPSTDDQRKEQIQTLRRALAALDLNPAAKALLARDEEMGYFQDAPFTCPTGGKFDLVPLMLKQCDGALNLIEYDANSPERLLFLRLRESYIRFTGKPVTYNAGGAFVKFCAAVYEQTGNIVTVESVRDKVRKHVFEDVSCTSGNQTGRKYHPKGRKNIDNRRGRK